MVIDGGAEDDWVIFGATGDTTATLTNVETIEGGASIEVITLGSLLTGQIVDLKGGNDMLTLANANNSLTVTHVETVVGVAGDDYVVVDGAADGTFDLGAGDNT